ncbi:hypothetical protein Mext_2952 [Methylorubrum extorquens PA1]|nr:hypothetical protein Mext_2952 [Methylorubrum extorquens PA1]
MLARPKAEAKPDPSGVMGWAPSHTLRFVRLQHRECLPSDLRRTISGRFAGNSVSRRRRRDGNENSVPDLGSGTLFEGFACIAQAL